MTLTEPQTRALRVLAAADSLTEPRPVITSNRSTDNLRTAELLTVHHLIADQMVAAGLAEFVGIRVGLTDAGRALAREAGL